MKKYRLTLHTIDDYTMKVNAHTQIFFDTRKQANDNANAYNKLYGASGMTHNIACVKQVKILSCCNEENVSKVGQINLGMRANNEKLNILQCRHCRKTFYINDNGIDKTNEHVKLLNETRY